MLQVADTLTSMTIAAGEAFIMSIQLRNRATNMPLDHTVRRLALVFYSGGTRAVVETIEGAYVNDARGPRFAFVRDGSLSNGFYGSTLQYEVTDRLFGSRSVLARGTMAVEASAATVETFGSIIGRTEAQFTLYFDDANIVRLMEQDLLPYGGAALPVAPTITTPAAISSDGTPQVGEQLTGTDPVVANGSITRRRWLRGSTAVATTQAYTPDATGPLTWSVEVLGLDGSTITSDSTITVAAAATPGTVIVDPIVTRNGQQYTFIARRTGDLSSATSRTMQVAASTDYPPGSPASDWPGGYAAATANFAAGSATAPFTITAPVAAQPE